ncbi:MAG: hypothetical protein Q8K65_06620 [Alphaproteobacteria bacterium]|nr:hypothetical protein [Alphaproteobacteria bacterium]
MDKKVCVRFFQLRRNSENDMSFSDCLASIAAARLGEWIDLGDDVLVRLERHQLDGAFIKGEFTRKQTTNIPPKANGDGDPLVASADPIAHRAAFQYHPALSILALESNKQGMTLAKIDKMIKQALHHSGFDYLPVASDAAWEKFSSCSPRKMTLKVANPENLSVAENATRSVAQNLNDLKEIFGGPVIEVSVGFGRQREGALNKRALVSFFGDLIRQQEAGYRGVQKIEIKAEGEEEPIDLLLEQVKEKDVLDLSDTNIEEHYRSRRQFIERAFGKYLPSMRATYGQAAA